MVHRVLSLFPAGQTFLLANMIEWGPARHYLREACPTAGYKICNVIDALPASADRILWHSFQRLGGFDGMRDEAKEIVVATIRTRPTEVLRMAQRSFALSLITHAPGAELTALINRPCIDWCDYWLVGIIRDKFGGVTVQAYRESLQSLNAIPRASLRRIDDIAFPAALIVLLGGGLLAYRSGLVEPVALAILISAGFLINSAQSAIVSGVFDRYQARVTWLFPLAALLIIGKLSRLSVESDT
jgi:hypothetical protein